jgi:hypothetical protein
MGMKTRAIEAMSGCAVVIDNLAEMDTLTMIAIESVSRAGTDAVLKIGAVRNILRAHDRLTAARHEYGDVLANAENMT